MANADLVAHWMFDGNAEDSAGSNDGLIYGATFTTGKVNQGLQFDCINDCSHLIIKGELR